MTSVSDLALDLTKNVPRSPRSTIGGYVVAARTLDKCRAVIAGTNGEYHFACPLDNLFFEFTGIDAELFKTFVATGADDDAVAAWIQDTATPRERQEVIRWNNDLRDKRISEMPIELQEFLEGYIPECLPEGAVVHVWFDVYDIEEGRLRPC
ncbi:MAG: DUF5069 domain-containing protein [Verrucomicrobiae bacterium]|nr:DUF5069 domain-containing protein [Verrucomicrobiae bacterium]